MAAFFTDHPGLEVADLKETAQRASELHLALKTARAERAQYRNLHSSSVSPVIRRWRS